MKTIILIGIFAIALVLAKKHGHDNKYKQEFKEFIEEYGREYANEEEMKERYSNFYKNMEKITKINERQGSSVFGITKFADYSEQEIRNMKMKPIRAEDAIQSCLASNVSSPAQILSRDPETVPASFDWRTKGVVGAVKNQGQCGSCWTFSTAENIESQIAIAGNSAPLNLSEQMIVDCSHGCVEEMGEAVCNAGCDGGWMWTAMADIISWGGLETEAVYPYTAETGTCAFNKTVNSPNKLYGPIKNYTCIGTNEDQIQQNLLSRGPLSIAMNADLLESYTSGILDPSDWWDDDDGCDPTSLDHALLLVGYGTEAGYVEDTPFWIIKNSWGEDWGEQGYFRIVRGVGACGMNNAVTCSSLEGSVLLSEN